MSQEESFQIFEEKPDHAYRTEIPNIVFELPLDLHEFKLYCFYKKVAGDFGSCIMSQENIAKKIGVSPDKQKKCNEKFRRPFELLGGKSLIRFYETKKEDGSKSSNQILIVNIWNENGKFYREKNIKKCPQDDVSPIPLGAGTPPAGSGSKKILIKKNRCSVHGGYTPPDVQEEKKDPPPPPDCQKDQKQPHFKLIKTHQGEKRLDKSQLFEFAAKKRADWTTEELTYAWWAICTYPEVIGDWNRFVEGTIEKLRKNGVKQWSKKSKKQTKNSGATTYKEPSSKRDTSELPLPESPSLMEVLKNLRNGQCSQSTTSS